MKCPICKTEINRPPTGELPGFHPFCSERCKLIDLGRWLSGKYVVPVRESEEEPIDRAEKSATDEIDSN
jgi:uncharacterized protein